MSFLTQIIFFYELFNLCCSKDFNIGCCGFSKQNTHYGPYEQVQIKICCGGLDQKISDERTLSQNIDVALNYLVEKMSIKKSIMKLAKGFKIKFSEVNAAFYSRRRNVCVNMGLDKAIFY